MGTSIELDRVLYAPVRLGTLSRNKGNGHGPSICLGWNLWSECREVGEPRTEGEGQREGEREKKEAVDWLLLSLHGSCWPMYPSL